MEPTKTATKIFSPTGRMLVRNDSEGSGLYGKIRDNGKRSHRGVDLLIVPGQAILAPAQMLLWGKFYPYSDDWGWEGVRLTGSEYEIKIFYCIPDKTRIGTMVEPLSVIATAQNISKRYSENMQPHVHVEVWVDGETVDPLPLLQAAGGTELKYVW